MSESMEINQKPISDEDEINAFNADVKLAEYQHRIESGQLTAEEEESRNKFLDFLGFPERKTNFHTQK